MRAAPRAPNRRQKCISEGVPKPEYSSACDLNVVHATLLFYFFLFLIFFKILGSEGSKI
jgi:hypothetical protein